MTGCRQDGWVVWVGENSTGNVTAIYQINNVLLFPKNFMFISPQLRHTHLFQWESVKKCLNNVTNSYLTMLTKTEAPKHQTRIVINGPSTKILPAPFPPSLCLSHWVLFKAAQLVEVVTLRKPLDAVKFEL